MDNVFAETNRQLNIKEVIQRYAGVQFNRNDQCCCPFHNEDTPSFKVYPKTNTYKCFGANCNASGDCVGFVAKFKGISPIDAVKHLQADFGLNIHLNENIANKPKTKDFKPYLEQCKKDVSKTDYLTRRGLSTETIERFNLGFDEKRKQIVIPYNRKFTYYQARLINEKKFFKPKNEDAGSEPIYNEETLNEPNNKEPIFIVESPIDAISIMQFCVKAVATCGGSAVNKFADKLKDLKPKPTFVISLDNDEPGIAASKELANLFSKEKIKHIVYSVSGNAKDPNELLQKNSTELKNNLRKARELFFRKATAFGELMPLSEIMEKQYPPREWYVKGVIGGGLGLLVAPPKTGKSFFALDMCISIASGTSFLGFDTVQHGVWYMALEDEQATIKERCKIVWKNKALPPDIRISFEDKYRLMDKKVIIDIDDEDALKSLTEYMEGVLYADPKIKFIVIDTFQLIRGGEKKKEGIYEGDYRETRMLKRFVTKHKVCIVLIHHTRKGKDENNDFNEVSGSNGLTGGVDFTILIQKKKASDNDAVLKLSSRYAYLEDQAIRFEREACKWLRVGSEKEQAEHKAKEEYCKNDFRKTIVHLLEIGGGQWQGTMSQLLDACGNLLGYCPAIVQPTQISKEIHRLEPLLLLYDDISYSAPKNGGKAGRQHWFHYKNREVKQELLNV